MERTAGRQSDHAEIYYRQLLTYEPEYSKGYLEYGLFFVQTGQISGKQSSIQTVEKQGRRKKNAIADAFAEEWQEWKKEAGIILGRTKQSFLEGAF